MCQKDAPSLTPTERLCRNLVNPNIPYVAVPLMEINVFLSLARATKRIKKLWRFVQIKDFVFVLNMNLIIVVVQDATLIIVQIG